ncbi:MAG: sensor histidine kinase, partial [Clostridia bacterium]|nr:sensor histidine kinase [Clostridia bacterium]
TNRKDEIGYLYRQFDIMMDEIDSLYKDIYESKIKQKEIELKALQAQINPHFLYNTLSSINWMAIDINANDISHAINALAKYYRFTLSKGKEIIPIYNEIEQVKAYIDIEKIRFGKKFDLIYDIDEGAYKYLTPKLILQPFVENSIKHSLEHIDYKCVITIIAEETENEIRFKITDNGKGIEKNILLQLKSGALSNSGYGIKNVVERINLLYGDKYGVSIESEAYRGTCITVNIPKLYIE